MLSDCGKPMNSCRDWAFSNSALEVGLPAFQLPMFAKCDALPKGDLLDMFAYMVVYKKSMPFVKSKSPLPTVPEAWGPWERHTLHHLCTRVASCLQKRELRYPRFGLQDIREAKGLVTQLWSPRFVTMECLCSQLWYETAANQRTLVESELLATVGWKWGCQPFSCPSSQNVTHCRKEICSTCLFKTSIPAFPFWNSKHPVSTRSRFLRATILSTRSALCLHHAHPFVAFAEKRTCSMQRSKAFGQAVDEQLARLCF